MIGKTYLKYILLLVIAVSSTCFLLAQTNETEKINPDDIDAFIETSVSKISVHIEDTLTVSYKLYTTHNPSRILRASFPQSRAFYSSEIRSSDKVDKVERNGKIYHVIEIHKVVMQPKTTGEFELSEGVVILQYNIPIGRYARDFFGNKRELANQVRRDINIEGVTIKVHDMITI